MVPFDCRCGHHFEVDDEVAKSGVRCPQCSELFASALDQSPVETDDIPFADMELAPAEPKPPPVRLRKMVDAWAGVEEPLLQYQSKDRTHSRFVGFLIRLKKDTTSLMDFDVHDEPPPRTVGEIFYALSRLLNVLGMSFILMAHFGAAIIVWATVEHIYFTTPLLLVFLIILCAHFVNVLDEIAVEEKDELPRFGREMRMREDIIFPCVAMFVTLVLCFAPIDVLAFTGLSISRKITAGIVLLLIGAFPFPAMLLTLATSGAIVNMRPDRVRGVINILGKKYFVSVLLFVGGIVPYLAGAAGFCVTAFAFADVKLPVPRWLALPAITVPLLCLGLFVLHAFIWHLGLLYREHSAQFPWVGREAVREIPKPPVQRTRRKYVVPVEPIEFES